MNMNIEAGMKVRINKMYCDVKADGVTRESNLRYVVMNMDDGYVLLAKTKRMAENGEGYIHSIHDIIKVVGQY